MFQLGSTRARLFLLSLDDEEILQENVLAQFSSCPLVQLGQDESNNSKYYFPPDDQCDVTYLIFAFI